MLKHLKQFHETIISFDIYDDRYKVVPFKLMDEVNDFVYNQLTTYIKHLFSDKTFVGEQLSLIYDEISEHYDHSTKYNWMQMKVNRSMLILAKGPGIGFIERLIHNNVAILIKHLIDLIENIIEIEGLEACLTSNNLVIRTSAREYIVIR